MYEYPNKKAKPMKVAYIGADAPIRHKGRTLKDPPYIFPYDTPVKITDPVDIEFFTMKCENNPECWKVVK